MEKHWFTVTSDKNGVLRVEIPGGDPDTDYEIQVTVERHVQESEIPTPPGSAARHLQLSREAAIEIIDTGFDAEDADAVLNAEFADYLSEGQKEDKSE